MEVPRPALRPTPLTCRSGSKVAILFDWENVPVGAAGTEARRNAIKAILALASTYGDIVYARAFADFDHSARLRDRDDLLASGVRWAHVPMPPGCSFDTPPKDLADKEIVETATTLARAIRTLETFVLVSGDGGYVDLVRYLQRLGRRVVVIARDGSSSGRLQLVADAYVSLEREILASLPPTVEPAPTHPIPLRLVLPLPTPGHRRTSGPAQREASRGRPATRRGPGARSASCDGLDPSARLDVAIEDVGVVLGRIQQRSSANTLAEIKKQLVAYPREFDERSYGFPTFMAFMAEAERRGALQVFTSRSVACAYVPGEPIGFLGACVALAA